MTRGDVSRGYLLFVKNSQVEKKGFKKAKGEKNENE